MKKKTPTVKELKEYLTLEDILCFLNGKKEKMYLKKMKIDKEGYVVKWGTSKGEETYRKLTEILYGLGRLLNKENEMNEIVEELDYIVESCDDGDYETV